MKHNNVYGYFMLLFMVAACNSYSKENRDKVGDDVMYPSNSYADFDPFLMKGIDKLQGGIKFPYLTVDSLSADSVKITYRSKGFRIEKIYCHKQEYWLGVSEYAADTGYTKAFEFVFADRIIELEYNTSYDKSAYYLHSGSELKGKQQIAYSYFDRRGIKLNPEVSAFDTTKKYARKIIIKNFDQASDIFKVTSRHLIDGKIEYADTSCYNIGGRSLFWWYYFGGDITSCK